MASKKVGHVHKYKRTILGKDYQILRCMVPACMHYISLSLAEGKLCECWRCGNPMVLDKRSVRLAKPHCENCVEHKSPEIVESMSEILDKIRSRN
jgi:hypothetical protein